MQRQTLAEDKPLDSLDRWRRVEDIFLVAADLPAEQRERYLREACGDDTDLRQEAESLLARDSGESPAIASIVEGAAASLLYGPPIDESMVGARLGNYEILREIGRSGMGAV